MNDFGEVFAQADGYVYEYWRITGIFLSSYCEVKRSNTLQTPSLLIHDVIARFS